MAKFVYRGEKRNVESVVRRSKQSGGSYDSYMSPACSFLKPSEGENQVRILPPTWEDVEKWGDGWEVSVYLHRDVGPDKGTYLCLDKMLGKPCPVCAARRDAADEEEADALRPQWRALAWSIDRNDEKAGPLVFGIGIRLFREINARSVSKKTQEVILIDDPEEGYDIFFNREGSGQRTQYTGVDFDRNSSPIAENEDQQDKWLDFIQANPLPDQLIFHPAEHIEKVLFGNAKGGSSEGGSSRRGRSRDADEAETDTRSARRGRGDEEGSRRRGGRDSDPPEEDVSARRGRRGGGKEGDQEEERSVSRRSVRDEGDGERTRRYRPGADAEEETGARRGRRTAADDDIPSEGSRRGRRQDPKEDESENDEEETTSRRARRSSADEDKGEGAEDDVVGGARRQLDRLKERRARR